MLNTVVRQIAFYEFERRVHDERRQGELLPERHRRDLAARCRRESLGPAFDFDARATASTGAYIPHFIHTPFYVYAYAFGDCLVNSLYAVYQDGSPRASPSKYLDMLRGRRHASATRTCWRRSGSTPRDPAFWDKGLDVICAASSTSWKRWADPSWPRIDEFARRGASSATPRSSPPSAASPRAWPASAIWA